jgi:hypothetical protein
MKKYTFFELESLIVTNLYYSMGVNRMKWYDYDNLVVPGIKREIRSIIHELQIIPIKKGYSPINRDDKYDDRDMNIIIKNMKDKYEMFGNYEGGK